MRVLSAFSTTGTGILRNESDFGCRTWVTFALFGFKDAARFSQVGRRILNGERRRRKGHGDGSRWVDDMNAVKMGVG